MSIDLLSKIRPEREPQLCFDDLHFEAAGSAGIAPAEQEQNARKAITPFLYDTMEVHPLAKTQKDDPINSLSKQGAVQATEQKQADDSSLWNRVYGLAQWVWGFVFGNEETMSSVNDPNAPGSGKIEAQDIKPFIDTMRQLMGHIKEMTEEEFSSFEVMLHEVYRNQIRDKEAEVLDARDRLTTEFTEKRRLNGERLAKLDAIISTAGKCKIFQGFDRAATAMGLIPLALGLSTGWGAVAFIAALGLAADQIYDDATKKKLASVIGGSNEDRESKLLFALQTGCGIATLGIFAGFGIARAGEASSPLDAINTFLEAGGSVSKSASTGLKGWTNHKHDLENADLKEIHNSMLKTDDKTKKEIGATKSILENISNHYRNLSRISQNQLDAAISLTRV